MSQVEQRAAAWPGLRFRRGHDDRAPAQRPPRIRRRDWAVVVVLLLITIPATPAVTAPDDEFSPPLLDLGGHWRDEWWAWLLQLALVVPLLWRRRAPLAVFVTVAVAAFVQWLAGPELYGDLAVLVALYTVVAYELRPRVLALVLAIAALGLLLALQRWALGTSAAVPAVFTLSSMLAVPVALGVVTRNRNRVLVATRDAAIRDERARIAGEMHDVVAHNLSVMVALADGARLTIAADPAQAATAVEQIGRTGREGLAEMRRLLGVLHDADEDAPLRPQPGLADLPELVARVRAAGVEVRLTVDDRAAEATPSGVALAVHRIVQEALTNVLRHAPSATRAAVTISLVARDLRLTVEDDGGGGPEGARPGGTGVAGMTQRAELLGGSLTAGPHASGWLVTASLPLDAGAPS